MGEKCWKWCHEKEGKMSALKILKHNLLQLKNYGANNGDSGSNVFILQVNVIFAERPFAAES